MKKLASLTLALGLVSLSGVAQAQEFGTQGRAVFGAERLFGLSWGHHWQKSQNPLQPDPVVDTSGFGFMWQPGPDPRDPFNEPRAAFDYFVIDHLSVGGSLGYVSGSVSTPVIGPMGVDTGTTVSADYSSFIFAPRVGYAYMFGSVVGIWPHGGFSYHSYSIDLDQKGNGFALDLDAMFVFAIAPHFAITAGPTFDVDLTGSMTPFQNVERDAHFRQFGIQAGLLGWL